MIVYTQTAPTAFAEVGWKYFLVFILVPAAGLFPFMKFYPETKQLSLEEVSRFQRPLLSRESTSNEFLYLALWRVW